MSNSTKPEATPGQLIKELKKGGFKSLRKIDQGGALQARKLSSGGVQLYWRYTHNDETYRVIIGAYSPSAPPKSSTPTDKGYSIAAAVEECRVKAQIHRANAEDGGYRQHVAKQLMARADAKAKILQEEEHTFYKLLETYANHLEQRERRSHADARSLFRLHVLTPFPALASSSAASVQPKQITEILRRLFEEDKGRTANKLRAYIRAAYQCGADVNSLASLPRSFAAFGIRTNPAAMTKRDASFDKADKNPLSIDELRAYWKLIKHLPGIKGASLRLHLLSGGQRIQQLVKLRNADVTRNSFTIFDAKGRPGQGARKHVVPLLPFSRGDIKLLGNEKEYALSTDGGVTHLSGMTLSNWAKGVAERISGFQLKRVRSGIETALAAARVSREHRGHLQSHGLSGVQARHYDDHDYFNEKLEALQTVWLLIEPKKATRSSTSSAKRQRRTAGST